MMLQVLVCVGVPLAKRMTLPEDAVCAGPDDGYLKATATHYKFKSLDQCKHTMALMFMQGYYKVTTKRHSHTHTDTASTSPFLRLSLFSCLSAVSLSACVFLVSSSLLPLFSFNPFFSHRPSTCFFHSVSCHCLSALSHSQHSSLSPCLASFFCLS